ncbi:hypothetical protein [Nocardioides marmoraquaticus]
MNDNDLPGTCLPSHGEHPGDSRRRSLRAATRYAGRLLRAAAWGCAAAAALSAENYLRMRRAERRTTTTGARA